MPTSRRTTWDKAREIYRFCMRTPQTSRLAFLLLVYGFLIPLILLKEK